MTLLRYLLSGVLLLLSGQISVYAQSDSSDNAGSGSMEVASCCNVFAEYESCMEICLRIHATPMSDLLDPALRNCSMVAYDYYKMCIAALVTASVPTTNTTSAPTSTPTLPPANTPAAYHCCAEANTSHCRSECQRLILAEGSEKERYDELVAECGPDRAIFHCFLEHASSTPTTDPTPQPTDLIRRRCCHAATSDHCRDNCLKYYEDFTSDEALQVIESDCVHQPSEGKLASCLADVTSACKLGCSDMNFCSTFNNRPNQLFRQCFPKSDDLAKGQLHEWQTSRQFNHTLAPTMRLKDINYCLPEMWKLLACYYHTEPCHPVALTTYMCREDCMTLFTECSENLGHAQVEKFCEKLSSSSNSSCLPLSTFIDQHDPEPIYQPCNSNPCSDSEVCQVNNECSPSDSTCDKYKCVRGCSLGNGIHDAGSVPVPKDTIVQIQLPEDDNCTSYVQCSSVNLFESYTEQSVKTANHCHHHKVCTLEDNIYEHGESFQVDCKSCYCNYGRVICTSKNCTGSPYANCSGTAYDPVCTPSGQTVPNRCIALCQGWRDDQLRVGNCGDISPCRVHNCPIGTRCVEDRRVCMGKSSGCSQYTCERNRACQTTNSSEAKPACDTDSRQWNSVCQLLDGRERLAYRGFCKPECALPEPVCGMDGNVYTSSCHAGSYHVKVDYDGVCHASTLTDQCANVTCPELQPKGCVGVVPAGACCPTCGGVVEILFDTHHLHRTAEHLEIPHISVQDVLKELNMRLSTVECVLRGHTTVDGTFVVVSVPTSTLASAMMVQVCNAEAALIASCVNNKSPLYLSSPILSHLLQAELYTSPHIRPGKGHHHHSSASLKAHHPSRYYFMIVLTVLLLLFDSR